MNAIKQRKPLVSDASQNKGFAQNRKVKTLIEKIGRFLWRSHADQGEMVGTFEEQTTFWNKEARKILFIIRRHNGE